MSLVEQWNQRVDGYLRALKQARHVPELVEAVKEVRAHMEQDYCGAGLLKKEFAALPHIKCLDDVIRKIEGVK